MKTRYKEQHYQLIQESEFKMTSLHHLNILQNELHDILGLTEDCKLYMQGEEVRANFIDLHLHSVFQPIIDLRINSSLGYEALLRASDTNGNSIFPLSAFKKAEEVDRIVKFDRLCRTLHSLNFLNREANNDLLFLNVHPELLVSVDSHGKVFEQILHNHHIPTHKVVIEIYEGAVSNEHLLRQAVANYRDRGYKIAVDDFGKEHSNLERLWALAPDYVKLDGGIIQNTEFNQRLQRVLPKLVNMITESGAEVIVEGVETEAQKELAQQSGIYLMQGYFFGRPASFLAN